MAIFLKKSITCFLQIKLLECGSKIASLSMSAVPELILSHKPLFSKALQFKRSALAQNLLYSSDKYLMCNPHSYAHENTAESSYIIER